MSLLEKDFQNINVAKQTIQSYAQVLSAIKGSLTPHQKNWEEFSLKVYANGLTATPIPIKRTNYFEALDLNINMVEHKLKIFCSGERLSVDLKGQSQAEFASKLKSILEKLQIEYIIPEEKFTNTTFGEYSQNAVEEIWTIIREVYFAMLQFKGDKLEETSSISFWAHHFDLAMLMLNGNILVGQDINNWDYSREQMNYGFSFGDDAINHPYFYITQYPFNEKMFELQLKEVAYWNKVGWNGAVLEITKYDSISEISSKAEELFNSVYKYVKNKL